MDQYLALGQRILAEGCIKEDRTGTGTLSVFGSQMRFDLTNNRIAAITTKKVHFPSVIHELIWMLSGDTNVRYLQENGVRIWNEWAESEDLYKEGACLTNYERLCSYAKLKGANISEARKDMIDFTSMTDAHAYLTEQGVPTHHAIKVREKGSLGKVYGHQWRHWESAKGEVDQIKKLIETLTVNPDDRRMIVSAWNVGQLSEMNLPPCHMMFQVYSEPTADGKRLLSLQIYQRSVDYFLGLPFNLAFYSILCHLLAKLTNHIAKELIHIGGDVHIYSNHMAQVNMQLEREPFICLPQVFLADRPTIDDYRYEDIVIAGYAHHPHIAGKVSV